MKPTNYPVYLENLYTGEIHFLSRSTEQLKIHLLEIYGVADFKAFPFLMAFGVYVSKHIMVFRDFDGVIFTEKNQYGEVLRYYRDLNKQGA